MTKTPKTRARTPSACALTPLCPARSPQRSHHRTVRQAGQGVAIAVADAVNAAIGEEFITMTKAEGSKPAQAELKADTKVTDRRPQSARASRLRQHASLSRLHAALSRPPRIISPRTAGITMAAAARRPRRRWKTPSRRLEGPACAAVALLPSGLAAVSTALLAVLKSGDHVLVTDSVYGPTRTFCDTVLTRCGVDDHLLRSAHRRRHRRADAAEHPRGVHRDARAR